MRTRFGGSCRRPAASQRRGRGSLPARISFGFFPPHSHARPTRPSPPRYHLTTHLLICYKQRARNERPQEPKAMLGPPAKTATPTKNPQIPISMSNRESLRLETGVTHTKQTAIPISNREVEPLFTTQSPPRRPNTSPNSNRERLRLETAETQTKRSPAPSSNREKEACFFGPSRGGCFSPPAVRPRFCRRVTGLEVRIHPGTRNQILIGEIIRCFPNDDRHLERRPASTQESETQNRKTSPLKRRATLPSLALLSGFFAAGGFGAL